jgi:acetylglutamate kinase
MDSTRDIILNLLHNLGSPREIDKYMRHFAGVERPSTIVVKVGGGIIAAQLDELASAIALLKRLGICPIIVHGGGPQLSDALHADGVESEWIEGKRVTTPEVLTAARRVFQNVGVGLSHALAQRGVTARPIVSGVFEATPAADQRLGLVGDVGSVDLNAVDASIDLDCVPIISPLGETASGQILNINADEATRALASAVRAIKVVFLTPTGGLLDEKGAVMPAINLAEDYDSLMRRDWVSGGMALKLREIKTLVDALPIAASVSITSPAHLASELFTHKGHGTLVRRGTHIREHNTLDEIDTNRLRRLLESSFNGVLIDDYFVTTPIERVILADDYTAAAVITADGRVPYMDKFAVTVEAQGDGMGASLWERVAEAFPKLFWRARIANRINGWYLMRCDGARRVGEWVVFWRGLSSQDEIESCVAFAEARGRTILPKAPATLEAKEESHAHAK